MVNWKGIAAAHNFRTSRAMLQCWYIKDQKSIQQICEILRISATSLQKELMNLGIMVRKNGNGSAGRGRIPGKFRCRHCQGMFDGDVRNVCCSSPGCRAKEEAMIRQMKYQITRRRLSRKTDNPCHVCGRDKGKNRWYCRECLVAISVGSLFD